MAHRLLMAEQWDEFARAVLPPGCSIIQRKEMRRAFYAGAQAIVFKVMAALSDEPGATREDMEVISGLTSELEQFAREVLEGRA